MVPKKKMAPMYKALIWFAIIFSIFMFTIMVILLIPHGERQAELKTLPEQTAYVEVVRLDTVRSSAKWLYTAWLKFPDGTEKRFDIGHRNILKNETGTLTYKELPHSEGNNYSYRLFIKFEKDLDLSNSEENIQRIKRENLINGLGLFVFFPILMLFIFFGGILIDKRKIRSLIKSLGGHVIGIKKLKTGSITRPINRRDRKYYYARYKVVYQIENQKIECIADFETNTGELRLFNEINM